LRRNPKGECKHCRRYLTIAGRHLCITCWRNTEIRDQYAPLRPPPKSQDTTNGRGLDTARCPYPPGHPLRVEFLRQRAERLVQLFREDDARLPEPVPATIFSGYVRAIRYLPHRRGTKPHALHLSDLQYYRLLAAAMTDQDSEIPPVLFAGGSVFLHRDWAEQALQRIPTPTAEAFRESA
jgi:hypothetical protein